MDAIASSLGEAESPTAVEHELSVGDKTFSLVAFPISRDDGGLEGVGSLIWDITERRREQMELSESRDRLQLFIENLPAGAALIAEDESVRVNTALEIMTGYSRAQLQTVQDWFRLAYGDQSAKSNLLYREIKKKAPNRPSCMRRSHGLTAPSEFSS